jgi:3-deoxy-D-arabino-heptulosonate 7-phosphate (DAHP) synthase class II
MIKSMTGFAALTREDELAAINVTLRAVNHRYLDLQLRVPSALADQEQRIRGLVQGGFADLARVQQWNQAFVATSPQGERYAELSRRIEESLAFMAACGLSPSTMPQLRAMQWDYRDQLQMSRRQAVNADDQGGVAHQGERTFYVYDSTGQRVRTAALS